MHVFGSIQGLTCCLISQHTAVSCSTSAAALHVHCPVQRLVGVLSSFPVLWLSCDLRVCSMCACLGWARCGMCSEGCVLFFCPNEWFHLAPDEAKALWLAVMPRGDATVFSKACWRRCPCEGAASGGYDMRELHAGQVLALQTVQSCSWPASDQDWGCPASHRPCRPKCVTSRE
jgi:hypothetical protein